MIDIKVKLLPPTFPNFIKIMIPGEHLNERHPVIDIGDLDDGQLEAYAEKWKRELVEHAKRRRRLLERFGP